MGREVRRVPPGWDHPKEDVWDPLSGRTTKRYKPLRDEDFESSAREWMDNAIAWDNGTHPEAAEHKASHQFYWQWSGGPPDPKYYRPKWAAEEATWYQVYEDVSEGTPVTPPFPTEEALIEHLVQHGDGWDRPVSRAAAEAFVKQDKWVPSMMFGSSGSAQGVEISRLSRLDEPDTD